MANDILNPMAQSLPISPTIAMAKKATHFAQNGYPVISLSLGEPDTQVPEWIKEAAVKAIRDGHNRYSSAMGVLQLREAIVQKLLEENHLTFYSPDNIILGCGAKYVIFSAMLVSLRPRDEVILVAPYWGSYAGIVEAAGAHVVVVPTFEKSGFKVSPETLERAITPYTRWVILNSPNNPSGAVYSTEELSDLADVLERHPHVWVLSDDMYEYFVYDQRPFVSIGEVAPFLKSRLFVVNGFSKSFSMMGWRVGYAAGPISLIRGIEKLNSQSIGHPCTIAQQAAIAALTHDHRKFVGETCTLFQKRRDVFCSAINTIPGVNVSLPEGAFYAYVNCQNLLGKKTSGGRVLASDVDIANALLDEMFVSTVPGTDFGHPGYLRMSYVSSLENLEAAAERIAKFVSELS